MFNRKLAPCSTAIQTAQREAARRTRRRRRHPGFQPRLESLEARRLFATDVILEWNEVLLGANAADHALAAPDQGGPILTSRAFAIVSAAMYDAYNSVERIGDAYLTVIPRAGSADADVAVAQAAHDLLVSLYPEQASQFDSALQTTLDRISDGPSETLGRQVGAAVASQYLASRADDGVDSLFSATYLPSGERGFHDADPLHAGQGFYAAGAMDMTPFVVTSLDQFAARRLDDGTAAGRAEFLASEEYRLAYEEVSSLGGDGVTTPTSRTAEQTLIGEYWAYDGRPDIGTPPRLYNQIARTVAIQEGNTEAQNARLFALLNLAMADAGLTAWNNKYDDAFWRPVLGIRQGDADGNPATAGDADWTPLGAPASNPRPGETNFTPPFPAYTSGHATFGAAAFQILTRYFGRDDVSFTFVSDELNGQTLDADGTVRPLAPRTFDSFSEAKWENAQSRIYLGIHWAFDRDEGVGTGDRVADFVFDSVLSPKHKPSRHNEFDPEDVNDDGTCTPMDALLVVNELNAGDGDQRQSFADVNNDGHRTPHDVLMIVNRLNRPSAPSAPRTPTSIEFRTLDGTGNNREHPDWGSTGENLLRVAPAEYADGVSAPAGQDLPSPREVSNVLVAHEDDDTPNDRHLTAYLYVWGQFLDHDLDLTGSASPAEFLPITVPTGDPSFDPQGTGTAQIPFTRSIYDPATGTSTANPRQQVNQITAWIDGSMIYGSDVERAAALRTFSGGKLKSDASAVGELLPRNEAGLENANDSHRAPDASLFVAGDVRANENIELTALHTLFLREHNRLADEIAAANRGLSDEAIFQRARALVIAEIQSITYNEWLPSLLGSSSLRPYRGYDATVNPGISNEFSTAAFRLHTTINDDVEFFGNDGRPLTFTYVDDTGFTRTVEGEIPLSEAFFNPTLFSQTGLDGILKYAASTHAEELDTQLVDSLRDFLFGPPGKGGLDLASLNIQRGRDHGLAGYNATRVAYGLPAVQSFSEITSDPELRARLEQLYGSPDRVELWVGVTAEDHVRGSSVGPLMQRILADQFQRLRDGDRWWYQRVFSGQQLAQLERTRLSDVIERNSDVVGLQDNVFFFRAEVSGQVYLDANGDGEYGRRERVFPSATVELLDDAGEAIATTTTGRDGRFRFDNFRETGDYMVRVLVPAAFSATTAESQHFAIESGDARLRSLAFGLQPFNQLLATAGEGESALRIASLPADSSGPFITEVTSDVAETEELETVLPDETPPALDGAALATRSDGLQPPRTSSPSPSDELSWEEQVDLLFQRLGRLDA